MLFQLCVNFDFYFSKTVYELGIFHANQTTIYLFPLERSVSVVTHMLVKLHKTCMTAILKAHSIVINENRRNKVLTVIKQLKMREFSKDIYFSLH